METTAAAGRWDEFIFVGASIFLAIAILILVYYELRLIRIKDLKERYDYVNLHEIRYFWYAVLALIVSGALFSNSLITRIFDVTGEYAPYIKTFYTAGIMVIAYFGFSSLVKILYPRMVDRRLQRIRNRPRVSPAGNKMRKLSEGEEDVHLEASQVAEQTSEIHSVDYDVWVDEKTGFKKVEKYWGYQHAEQCSECGFYTMKIYEEEIEKKPTQTETGLLLKHYQCSYCRHREAKEVVIAMLATNV